MSMTWTHIAADYINVLINIFQQHFHILYIILYELLLYVIPHIILKYSPKGEGYQPSYGLEIKQRPPKEKSIQIKRETGFGSLSGGLRISTNCENYE